jgi:hypothetical protein
MDANFDNGVMSVLPAFFQIQAANTLFMTIFDLSNRQNTRDAQTTIVECSGGTKS